MSEGALPKGYEFAEVESHWYNHWEKESLFRADAMGQKLPYSIVIPPPNVTGQLHIGHALNNTLQDILCRYKRLRGFEVLWAPGTDHAGIATQNVVERQLGAEGLTRHGVGREAFVQRVWEWKARYGGIIINQLKRLGASCDWSRERFTMDEGLSTAVRQVFVSLYEAGLIYRGRRMINWCPRCMTALANIEVDGEELDSFLYYIRYPLPSGKGSLVVATTRPETMLGDTAVAVNPEDHRYRAYIGQKVILPIVGRNIPVIGDPYVEREFGTGALKVTPAHDFNDFELCGKHHLELVQVIDERGIMTEQAGRPYAGMDRFACRKQILKDLNKSGHLVKTEPYKHRVGHCYRCHNVVEPMLSLQWFVATRGLAQAAIEAVKEGKTRIIPAKWEKDYFNWLENLEDWCISRQIWWGHRIPAWYCPKCNDVIVSMEAPKECPNCPGAAVEQDPDVLDTWLSSSLWPFSILGWPDKTLDLEKFYPTSVLVTAFDILFFWVARMMMMGLEFMKEVPFRQVYVHALVRDAEGQKMSKSRGNVIDPLLMMDKYGTDALRFALTAFAAQGRDIRLSEERIEGYKHFVNKIWNAARLVLMNLADFEGPVRLPEAPAKPWEKDRGGEVLGLAHRWILSRLQRVAAETVESLDNYYFNQYAQVLYQFLWHEYCDWYLEIIKPDLYGRGADAGDLARSVAAVVLEKILILLHPVMPFITEEVWHRLPHTSGMTIMKAAFPEAQAEWIDPEAEEQMETLMAVIVAIRNIRGEMNVSPALKVEVACLCVQDAELDLLKVHQSTIADLGKVSKLTIAKAGKIAKPRYAAGAVVRNMEVFVVLKDILDFDSESSRLQKELAKLEKELGLTHRKLSNDDFLQKAPHEVIEKEREKNVRLGEKIDKLNRRLEIMNGLRESRAG
ncbi:MAG TPA: valine--tRNA ligase [Syntrophobacteraceae bacterium]|nr:valine--tRNA ligase [Syntrophobacteraceae bacterium]